MHFQQRAARHSHADPFREKPILPRHAVPCPAKRCPAGLRLAHVVGGQD
jgi:hypothetical protein